MKVYTVIDLNDNEIGTRYDESEAIKCFRDRYPSWHPDKGSVLPFINEKNIHFTKCLDSYYEGLIKETLVRKMLIEPYSRKLLLSHFLRGLKNSSIKINKMRR